MSHQYAVFNSLVYRLVNLPLDKIEYQKEYLHILDKVKINGFKEETVKKKIGKFKRMKSIHETSTLSSESPKKTYMRMTYHPWMLNKLNKVFKPYNIHKFSVKNLIGSNTKDKIPIENKSGVYQIDCIDCDKIFIYLIKWRDILNT